MPKKKPKTTAEILRVYEMIESAQPDISTEQLLARTADQADVDYDDVVSALAERWGR